jgi:CHAT domain-containing protein
VEKGSFDGDIPPHVFIDPGAEVDSGAALRSVPWMGARRAISVVADALQLIGSRGLPRQGGFVAEFLGVGSPMLAGSTSDGMPRRSAALRGMSSDTQRSLQALSELPETAEELDALAKIFGAKSRILIGALATESRLRKEELTDYRVLSFATHGLLRDEIPGLEEPALLLTPQDSRSSDDDGLLTASEIAGLSLRADLVMLSACNSATFRWQRSGSDVEGLSSAFFVAGTRSTLASVWSVDSKATKELMELFAVELRGDRWGGTAVALQRAVRRFIEESADAEFAHPRFWAAFMLFGDGGPDRTRAGPRR